MLQLTGDPPRRHHASTDCSRPPAHSHPEGGQEATEPPPRHESACSGWTMLGSPCWAPSFVQRQLPGRSPPAVPPEGGQEEAERHQEALQSTSHQIAARQCV